MIRRALVCALMSASVATMSFAQNVTTTPGYAELQAMQVPVTEGDVTDRPYRVVGHIQAGVRKATIFSGSPSREKVFRELWERGKKLDADAVIHAEYGESRITGLSWGAREARGVAIKFLTDAEVEARRPKPDVPLSPPTAVSPHGQ